MIIGVRFRCQTQALEAEMVGNRIRRNVFPLRYILDTRALPHRISHAGLDQL